MGRSRSLDLSAGETKTGVDADLEPGVEIRGTVDSAVDGSPLAKVSVCALFYEEIEGSWFPAMCVPTRSGGEYSLPGLWSDNYRVACSLDARELFGEGPHQEDGYFPQYFNDKPTLEAADSLNLTAPETVSAPSPNASRRRDLRLWFSTIVASARVG